MNAEKWTPTERGLWVAVILIWMGVGAAFSASDWTPHIASDVYIQESTNSVGVEWFSSTANIPSTPTAYIKWLQTTPAYEVYAFSGSATGPTYTLSLMDTSGGGNGYLTIDANADTIDLGTLSSVFNIRGSFNSTGGGQHQDPVEMLALNSAEDIWYISNLGDSNAKNYQLNGDGTVEWGTNAAGLDTNLYRSGANELTTDDSFTVGANFDLTGYADFNDAAAPGNPGVGTTRCYGKTGSSGDLCCRDSAGTETCMSAGSGSFTDIDTDYGAETVTSAWSFEANNTGAFGAFDLDVGDGANHGAISVGNIGIYSSSYSTGNIDLGQAFVLRQEGTLDVGNDPGIEFAFLESVSNTIRLAIPESASGNATAFIRSGTFAGPYSAAIGNDIVLCDQWTTFDSNIDCDTSGTGADLFVQDDFEVEGTIYAHETINLEGATADGNQVILQVGADPGADVTLTLPTATGTMVAFGDGVIDLGADTAGNYMVDVTGSNGITVTHTPAEGSTATLAVDILTAGSDGDSIISSRDGGLEFVGGELSLIRGCSDNEILVWDETNDDWNCEEPQTTVCKTIENVVAADDDVPMHYFRFASTILRIGCDSSAAATVNFQDGGGTNVHSGDITCSTGGTMTYTAAGGATSFTAGEKLQFDTISASSPTWTTLCFTFKTIHSQ